MSMSNEALVKLIEDLSLKLDQLQKVTGMSRDAIQKQQDSALSESRFRANYEDLLSQGKEKEAAKLMEVVNGKPILQEVSDELPSSIKRLHLMNLTVGNQKK